MPIQSLLDDADALDRIASGADWLEGLAGQAGEPEKAANIQADAQTLRNYAELLRTVSAAN